MDFLVFLFVINSNLYSSFHMSDEIVLVTFGPFTIIILGFIPLPTNPVSFRLC